MSRRPAAKRRALHPAVVWAGSQKPAIVTLRELATRLAIPYETLKGMVSGHRGCSVDRALLMQAATKGGIEFSTVLLWHSQNRRTRAAA